MNSKQSNSCFFLESKEKKRQLESELPAYGLCPEVYEFERLIAEIKDLIKQEQKLEKSNEIRD